MSGPPPETIRLAVPDRAFALSRAERERVMPEFDVAALERLLGMVRPDMRQELLRHFQWRQPGDRSGHIIEMHDPVLQAVLEEVWAPFWADKPDQALAEGWYPYPGTHRLLDARACRASAADPLYLIGDSRYIREDITLPESEHRPPSLIQLCGYPCVSLGCRGELI